MRLLNALGEAELKAAGALRDERAAQDRAREHVEAARQVREAWRQIRGRGTPAKERRALLESQAADQVAADEQATAEGKAAARAQADRELEAARSRVAENVTHMLRIWDTLQPLERQFVKQALTALAMLTGLYDEIKAKGAAERDAEIEGRRPEPGAFAMPVAMPGTAAR
jgi:hypothetical protein